MEIRAYFKIFARYWWLVLLVAGAAGAGAAVLSNIKDPVYDTQARIALGPSENIADQRDLINIAGAIGGRYIVNTYAQMFTSAEVKKEARKAAGLSDSAAHEYSLEANVLPETTVILLSGSGPDPAVLARYVNATVKATVDSTRTLYGSVMKLKPLEEARAPQEPTSPQPSRDIPLGTGLGLAVGILLALTLEYLRGPASIKQRAPAAEERTPAHGLAAQRPVENEGVIVMTDLQEQPGGARGWMPQPRTEQFTGRRRG